MRGRSTSEVIFGNIRRSSSLTGALSIHNPKLSVSLYGSNQNLLALPKLDDIERRSSIFSDGDATEKSFSTSDMESGEDTDNEIGKKSKSNRRTIYSKKIATKRKTLPKLVVNQKKPLLPIVAVIPPEEENLFLIQ